MTQFPTATRLISFILFFRFPGGSGGDKALISINPARAAQLQINRQKIKFFFEAGPP